MFRSRFLGLGRLAGFRALQSLGDAFSQPWQQWHGDPLAGGRGEIFHRGAPDPAVS